MYAPSILNILTVRPKKYKYIEILFVDMLPVLVLQLISEWYLIAHSLF